MATKPKKKPKSGQDIIVRKKRNIEKDPTALPNTFKFAADTLETMSERGGSAGSIVVNKFKNYNYKLIFALVMNTVKNIKIIKKIIYNTKLANQVPENNPFIIEILVGDLLYGKGLKSVEKNPTAAAIIGRKDIIIKEQNILRKEFVTDDDSAVAKYLRVNHLKIDINHVISQLKSVGITQLEYSKDKIKFKKFVNKFKSMDDSHFMLDFHFPNDLILLKPAGADRIKKTDLLRKVKATLQDKASFMAVEALEVKPSNKVIDACFAPGCKTSLIATKMKNKGKILAYDVDKKRLISAIRFLKLQSASCVQTELQDFSKVKLRRLLKIHNIDSFDSILIDPSCSGSGIKFRLDYKKTAEEIGRLKKLQAFQVSLLKHALKACVSKTIVYCTCSTSIEENEQVVEMALNESGVKSKWEVVPVMPYWPSRGDSSFEFGKECLRSDSNYLTNGFFIAKLKCNELYAPTISEQSSDKKPRKQSARSVPDADDQLSDKDYDPFHDIDQEESDKSEYQVDESDEYETDEVASGEEDSDEEEDEDELSDDDV